MFKYPSPPPLTRDEQSKSFIRGFALEPSHASSHSEEPKSLSELGRAAALSNPFEGMPEHVKTQMWKDFDTEYASVFVLSTDGKTFAQPKAVCGVPVERIDVTHPYWEASWTTLESVLANEKVAHENKQHYRTQADACGIDRGDRKNELRRKEKEASDDCSKYAKIREIFGDGKYHPNQIVAKELVPPEGLCEMNMLYKFALKISNLKDLYEKKKIKMDPFSFYRWAVAKQLQSPLQQAVTKTQSPLRAVIRGMGDEKKHCTSTAGEVFRAVVLYWAKLTGNERKFGSSGSKKQAQPQTQQQQRLQQRLQQRRRKTLTTSSQSQGHRIRNQGDHENARRLSLLELKKRRQAPNARASSLYAGGVNAYRESLAMAKKVE